MRFQNAKRVLRIEFFRRLRTSLLRFACSLWRTELKARKRRGCCGEADCSRLSKFFHVRNARADKLKHGNWLAISEHPQACDAGQRVDGISFAERRCFSGLWARQSEKLSCGRGSYRRHPQ